ncbi:hypothetical protein ACFY93_12305 [Streptomyces sp. NPDC008313]|uniref:hypothetical protein n=1 Tax=Streptomyces sp. NPDC008313 TaxID=3364826 RepID=UPI0036E3E8A8
MPEHVSILQLTGAALALAAVVSTFSLFRSLQARRIRLETVARTPRADALGGLPRQRRSASGDSLGRPVELTPAERDAFAVLVRQFGDSRP